MILSPSYLCLMRRIYLSNTFGAAFPGVISPWFHGHGRDAWRKTLPSIVVAPDSATIGHLKLLLHDNNIPTFGIELLPVSQLLHRLTDNAKGILPDAGLLELVTGQIASKLAKETNDEIAGAVSRGPRMLTDTLRALHQGGWDAKHVSGDILRKIGTEVEQALGLAGLRTEAQVSHEVARTPNPDLLFDAVLAVGFDARHWDYWPSLVAALRRSAHFTGVFAPARAAADEADLCWMASWEAVTGEAAESVDDSVSLAADAIELAQEGKVAGVTCLVAGNQKEEAALAIRCAAEALDEGAQHVAIVAPPNSVVSREVSLLLSRVRWPHFDGLPSRQAAISRPEVLVSLLRVQAEPFVANLAHFLKLRPSLPKSLEMKGDDAVRGLDRMAPNLIFPELSIAVEYIRSNGDKRILPLVEQWPVWPEEATLGEYLDLLVKLTEWIEWTPIQRLADELRHRLTSAKDLKVTRAGASKFMQEAILEPVNFRAEGGNNPYARILLLSPSAALYRKWDALVVVGQNDSIWPPRPQPGGYLSDMELRALNRRIRDLNDDARAQASTSGDGAMPVRDGYGYIVGPVEYRAMMVRDFIRLVDASAKTYVLCALRDESQGDQTLYPGELFSRSYSATTGQVPNQRAMEEVASGVSQSLPLILTTAPADMVDTKQLLTAWHARRRPDATEFSEYEFCMNARAKWDLVVPPSAWGRAFDRPAETFFKYWLGVTPKEQEREELATPMVTGNWIHAWLEGAAPTGAAAQGNEWVERIMAQSADLRQRVAAALKKQGREMPTWWDSIYDEALSRARLFAEALSRGGRHPYAISEAKLPRTDVQLASGRVLPVLGRMDLVFTDSPVEEGSAGPVFSGRPWLFDFKTGKDEVLSTSSIAKGEGVQLGLYSLALIERGAKEVDITLLRDDCEATPQVTSSDVRSEMMPWLERCADIVDTGRLGYIGEVHSERGGSIYPIATLSPNLHPRALKARFDALHSLI
jgi:hypothetical protein